MMGAAMASNVDIEGPSGRITANPLKHLASLLLQKLRDAQGGPCNLVQVATEIHAQAEDKHNTTLRRIYDVVNVCEGAGVLARTGHRSPNYSKKNLPASDSNVVQKTLSVRRTGKKTLRGGAEIQWLGGTLREDDCTSQIPQEDKKLLLETEKGQTLDRISQKKKICDTLSMQVEILQNLLEQNQAQCRLHPDASETDDCMDEFLCDYFVDEQRPCAAKRMPLPFVMLATTPEANVNVYMTSCQVLLELDRNYRLMDHTHVIKMLPDVRVYMQQ